jgi:hypothetical protein
MVTPSSERIAIEAHRGRSARHAQDLELGHEEQAGPLKRQRASRSASTTTSMGRIQLLSLSAPRLTRAVDNSHLLVDDSPPVAKQYSYELRAGEEMVATGWLTSDEAVEPGDDLLIAGIVARVADVAWTNGAARLVLEPRRLSA